MNDMNDLVENDVNTYVAGLRQLLESVEPIIRQANSLDTVEEILLNLETTDENFHKYELVKTLRELIETEVGPLIENVVKERGLDSGEVDFSSSVIEEIQASEAFSKVSNIAVTALQAAADEIIKSMTENGGHLSFAHFAEDRYQRLPNNGPDSCGEDSLLASSFDGDDFMFMSPQKYNALANQLMPGSPLQRRLEALNTLSQIPHTDLVNSEFWGGIKKGLSFAFKDENHILAEKSLKFHAKMFATASGHVTKEIYTSLSTHLFDYFQESTSHMVPIDSGLDLGDRRNIKILKEFRLLNQFQHELPLFWIRYPEKLVEEILLSTINLISFIPQPVSSNFSDAILSPSHFLSLIDPSAFWFCKWMHGNYSRAELIKHLSNNKTLLKEACKSCLDFVLHCKTQLSSDGSDDAEVSINDGNEALIYSKAEILCAHFIQSISILGRVLLYKEGQALFPIELEDRLETVTVTDLIVMFVEVISYLPPSTSDMQNLEEIEPSYLAANILKNVATASADTCISCICKDEVTNTFLQPVQKYLDGYLGVFDLQEKIECILVLTAEVLAEIASTCDGRYHLLYGEKQEKWQRSRLAPVHTIALFTKKALSGTLAIQPSAKSISAFLFVCRQLYNTCEGLMIISNFSLSDCISKCLINLRKKDENSPDNTNQTKSVNLCDVPQTFSSLTAASNQDIEAAFNPLNGNVSKSSSNDNHYEPARDLNEYITEDDLVCMSQSLRISSSATLHDSTSFLPMPYWKYSESLIDNLLNFMSTPKGVLLVQQTGILNECARYMNNRYQLNLQVSKIEKFGYGVMTTQIAATAPGMLALEKAGYFKTLLDSTWQCLEGVTNDYTKTVLSSNWDDFHDKACQKVFTSMVNLLSSFPSVCELISFGQGETLITEAHTSCPDNPVTTRNTFPVPSTFEELLMNLIFVETADRMRLLFHFERSHLFGLRVLSSLISCLDTFLLLQSKYRFQETLLQFQESQKLDDAKYMIDNCGVERNQILVRTFSIGGPSERIIPLRTLEKDPANPYPWSLFSTYPLPSEYIPHDSNTVMTAFEQQDQLGRFLTETEASTFSTLDEARGWLLKCRDVYVASLAQDPDTVGMKSVPHLMERINIALSVDPEEAILPLVEYSGNEALLQGMELSDMEKIGVDLVTRYGMSLRLIHPSNETSDQLSHLLKQCKYFLECQQRQFSSSLQTLQSGYSGFDWFVSSIYLMMGGKLDRCWEFLSRFSSLLASGYMWMARLHASIHLPKELQESGIHPVYSSICHNLELLLQAEIPQIYSAFRMSGYPPSQICQLWLRQCFWNYLDWSEICKYLCCCLLMGIDYQIYFCMAILKHLQRDIFLHTQQKDLSVFLRENPIKDFKLGNYINFMLELQKKYRTVVLPDLQDITRP